MARWSVHSAGTLHFNGTFWRVVDDPDDGPVQDDSRYRPDLDDDSDSQIKLDAADLPNPLPLRLFRRVMTCPAEFIRGGLDSKLPFPLPPTPPRAKFPLPPTPPRAKGAAADSQIGRLGSNLPDPAIGSWSDSPLRLPNECRANGRRLDDDPVQEDSRYRPERFLDDDSDSQIKLDAADLPNPLPLRLFLRVNSCPAELIRGGLDSKLPFPLPPTPPRGVPRPMEELSR